jgi:Raf kinase inhibitor-like YbhB/YbcL family protein
VIKLLKHFLWIFPLVILLAVISLVAYAATTRSADERYHSTLRKTLQVSSSGFQHEQEMPIDFSCRGRSMAPNIQWTGAPEGTRSFALVTMDWDAPSPRLKLFSVVHWLVYNIPAGVNEIPQDSSSTILARRNIASGLNFAGQPGYLPPCPPLGTHRYEFRVYALDVDRLQPASNDKAGLMNAMKGHVLGYGDLVGLRGP